MRGADEGEKCNRPVTRKMTGNSETCSKRLNVLDEIMVTLSYNHLNTKTTVFVSIHIHVAYKDW